MSKCLFSTDRVGSQIDVILFYSLGVSFTEVQEGLNLSSSHTAQTIVNNRISIFIHKGYIISDLKATLIYTN